MTSPTTFRSLRRQGLFAALTLLIACGESPTVAPQVDTVLLFAKGGGGPSVEAANPSEGPQGVTLDVRVLGSGFDNGSSAQWLLGGAAAGKVKTNSTTYVSKSELLANITIDADAVETLYDIEVTTRRGKKGVGSEVFSVKAKPADPPVIWDGTQEIAYIDGDQPR